MLSRAVLVVAMLAASACVDGKTPDCTEVDSGCYPSDSSTGPTPDATSDATTDAAADANDAAEASVADANAD